MAEEVVNTPNTEVPPVETTPPVEATPPVETPPATPQPDLRTQQALWLLEQLGKPETAIPLIREIAGRTGLQLTERAAPAVEKVKVQEILGKALGEEYSVLAERLGPAFEQAVGVIVNERMQPLQQRLAHQQAQQFQGEVQSTFAALENESKGASKALEPRMLELMDEIHPGKNTSVDKYIRRIYAIAKEDSAAAEAAQRVTKQIQHNAQNATGIPPGGATPNTERVKTGSRLPSIREAVQAAMKGQLLE